MPALHGLWFGFLCRVMVRLHIFVWLGGCAVVSGLYCGIFLIPHPISDSLANVCVAGRATCVFEGYFPDTQVCAQLEFWVVGCVPGCGKGSCWCFLACYPPANSLASVVALNRVVCVLGSHFFFRTLAAPCTFSGARYDGIPVWHSNPCVWHWCLCGVGVRGVPARVHSPAILHASAVCSVAMGLVAQGRWPRVWHVARV